MESLRTRQMEMDKAIQVNPFDMGAWDTLRKIGQDMYAMDKDAARRIWRRLLDQFPSSSSDWLVWIEWEKRHGENTEVDQLLRSCLSDSDTHLGLRTLDLWEFYVDWSIEQYRTTLKGDTEVDMKIRQAFESTLAAVGCDPLAAPLWQRYVDYLMDRKEYDMARHVYICALTRPLVGWSTLLKHYTDFERLRASSSSSSSSFSEQEQSKRLDIGVDTIYVDKIQRLRVRLEPIIKLRSEVYASVAETNRRASPPELSLQEPKGKVRLEAWRRLLAAETSHVLPDLVSEWYTLPGECTLGYCRETDLVAFAFRRASTFLLLHLDYWYDYGMAWLSVSSSPKFKTSLTTSASSSSPPPPPTALGAEAIFHHLVDGATSAGLEETERVWSRGCRIVERVLSLHDTSAYSLVLLKFLRAELAERVHQPIQAYHLYRDAVSRAPSEAREICLLAWLRFVHLSPLFKNHPPLTEIKQTSSVTSTHPRDPSGDGEGKEEEEDHQSAYETILQAWYEYRMECRNPATFVAAAHLFWVRGEMNSASRIMEMALDTWPHHQRLVASYVQFLAISRRAAEARILLERELEYWNEQVEKPVPLASAFLAYALLWNVSYWLESVVGVRLSRKEIPPRFIQLLTLHPSVLRKDMSALESGGASWNISVTHVPAEFWAPHSLTSHVRQHVSSSSPTSSYRPHPLVEWVHRFSFGSLLPVTDSYYTFLSGIPTVAAGTESPRSFSSSSSDTGKHVLSGSASKELNSDGPSPRPTVHAPATMDRPYRSESHNDPFLNRQDRKWGRRQLSDHRDYSHKSREDDHYPSRRYPHWSRDGGRGGREEYDYRRYPDRSEEEEEKEEKFRYDRRDDRRRFDVPQDDHRRKPRRYENPHPKERAEHVLRGDPDWHHASRAISEGWENYQVPPSTSEPIDVSQSPRVTPVIEPFIHKQQEEQVNSVSVVEKESKTTVVRSSSLNQPTRIPRKSLTKTAGTSAAVETPSRTTTPTAATRIIKKPVMVTTEKKGTQSSVVASSALPSKKAAKVSNATKPPSVATAKILSTPKVKKQTAKEKVSQVEKKKKPPTATTVSILKEKRKADVLTLVPLSTASLPSPARKRAKLESTKKVGVVTATPKTRPAQPKKATPPAPKKAIPKTTAAAAPLSTTSLKKKQPSSLIRA